MKKETVKSYFDNYPNENQLHVTSDDMPFLDKTLAENHALSLVNKDVESYDRADFENTKTTAANNSEKGKTAAELIEAIGVAETVEAIHALLPEGEKRATVVKAAEDRSKALAEVAKSVEGATGTEEETK